MIICEKRPYNKMRRSKFGAPLVPEILCAAAMDLPICREKNKALYAPMFLATFIHAMLTWDAWKRLPAGVWRFGEVRPRLASRG